MLAIPAPARSALAVTHKSQAMDTDSAFAALETSPAGGDTPALREPYDVLGVGGCVSEKTVRAILPSAVRTTYCRAPSDAIARLACNRYHAIVVIASEARHIDGVARLSQRAAAAVLVVLLDQAVALLRDAALAAGAQYVLLFPGPNARLLRQVLAATLLRRCTEQRRQQDLSDALDLDSHPLWLCDPASSRFLAANRAARTLYGYSAREFAAMTPDHLRHAGPRPACGIEQHRTRDGRRITVELRWRRMVLWQRELHLLGARDITAERWREQRLQADAARYAELFDHSAGYILVHDLAGRLSAVNPAAAAALGRPAASLAGTALHDLAAPSLRQYIDESLQRLGQGGEDSGLLRVRHSDGHELSWRFRTRLYHAGSTAAYAITYAQDMTATIAAQRELEQSQREQQRLNEIARTDALTGLANRTALYERLSGAVERSRGKTALLTVFYIDIDHFKPVNDTHGHAAGDALLRAFAARLRESVRSGDLVARIGGDEFVVLMEDLPDVKCVRMIAAKLLTALSTRFDLGGRRHVFAGGASIGVVACRQCSLSPAALIAVADDMLYEAKQSGRGSYRLNFLLPPAKARSGSR
ncbi:PAS domain S-box-containing protein/diguanylate cyclase (GGDEF)-like protein [Tahibacter aquaticus]|uniref:PAS domain S-box-containing protein/diguanylate cyclase (GGDEF)-like protein n=2 Tax=Tahibacter aquaticus TaxID=520092 RepID=A0A4R6YU05_9GAMM|nr:PAS domain S-box-containing protein/diguanylate cyclase (GGDEF)-like protein [Tahibacter aquaticus]